MQQYSRKEIMQLINHWEIKYPVDAWNVEGLDIWPFLRMQIFKLLISKKVTTVRSRSLKLKLTDGLFKVFFGFLDYLKLKKKLSSVAYLFVSNQAYRQLVKDVYFNRFSDPLMDQSEFQHLSVLLEAAKTEEFTKPNYKSNRLIQLSRIVECFYFIYQLRNKLLPVKNTKLRLESYDDFLIEIERDFPQLMNKLSQKSIKRIGNLIRFYSWEWNNMLSTNNLDKIIITCYYGIENMVLIKTAKDLKIPTIDIQHGVINELHYAYGSFKKVPHGGFNSLPQEFWVWSDYEAKVINKWSDSIKHKAINYGNIWVDAVLDNKVDFSNLLNEMPNDKPIVLYTLSNRDDIFPDFLVEAVKALKHKYHIWFRLHPRQIPFMKQIEEHMTLKGLHDIEIMKPTFLPLPLILKYASLHITQFSTVVIEAALFKVNSVLIHPVGKDYYAHHPFKKYFYFYERSQDLGQIINDAITSKR